MLQFQLTLDLNLQNMLASKAGMLGLMKNIAVKVAKYGATCNSLSCGGVLTNLNKPVMEDEKIMGKKLWK